MKKYLTLNAASTATPPLITQYNGRDHYVLPTTMLIEGVHSGSAGPLYYSPEELFSDVPRWNGMPIVVNHPTDATGNQISARQFPVLNTTQIGVLLDAKEVRPSDKPSMLVCTSYVDVELVTLRAPTLAADIAAGKSVEISTGLFAAVDETAGVWNDIAFVGSVHGIEPDHLAYLPTQQGACSMTKGCGAGAKQVVNAACTCGGVPSAAPSEGENMVTCACGGKKVKAVANQATNIEDDRDAAYFASTLVVARMISNAKIISNSGMTVESLREQLSTYARAKYRLQDDKGNTTQYAWVRSIDFIQSTFVIEIEGPTGLQLWQQKYTITDGTVAVSSDSPVQVVEQTQYVAANPQLQTTLLSNQETGTMADAAPNTTQNDSAKGAASGVPAPAAIANNAGLYPQGGMVLPFFMPQMQQIPQQVANAQPVANTQPAPATPPTNEPSAKYVSNARTFAEFINEAPEHLKPVANSVLAHFTAHRQAAIGAIMNSGRNTMSLEQLNALDHGVLMQVANMLAGQPNANAPAPAPAVQLDPFTGAPIVNAGASFAAAPGAPIGNAANVQFPDMSPPTWGDIVKQS